MKGSRGALLALAALLVASPVHAEVRLFFNWLTGHPTTLRTQLGGGHPVAPAGFADIHIDRIDDRFRVAWKLHPDATCKSTPSRQALQRASRSMAAAVRAPEVRRALKELPVAVTIHLVPEGRSFALREGIFRLGGTEASIAVGVHMACDDIESAPVRGALAVAHELTHVKLHRRDLHLVNNEALAYTAQACSWLDSAGRMPSTLEVAHVLPPILLDLFTQDTPREFLGLRFRNETRTSLRGGVLAQLNLGLFLGTEPVESEADPRFASIRGYCACVEAWAPDFMDSKPGELWRDSNGATCGVSAPATAPRNGR